MEYQDIIFEIKEGYAVLTLNRPKVLNAIRQQTKQEINDALDQIEKDDSIRGLIVTGTPGVNGKRGAFTVGSDISETQGDRTAAETEAFSRAGQALMDRFANLEVPVIAAVNGYALGGGLELALACDLRVAADNAVLGVPEVDLGVTPCYGGTQRLARIAGAGVAKDLLFTARQVRADEALQLGIVNRVVPADKLVEEAEALMKQILKNGPIAVRCCKKLVDKGLEMSLEEGLRYEAKLNGELAETEDAREGMRAFQEKRKPVFRNK